MEGKADGSEVTCRPAHTRAAFFFFFLLFTTESCLEIATNPGMVTEYGEDIHHWKT